MAPPKINSRNILLDICASVRDEEIDMSNALPRALSHPDYWGKENGKEITIKRLINRWTNQIDREKDIKRQTTEREYKEITMPCSAIYKDLCTLLNEFEKCDESEDHASKLTFLFPTATAALKWLKYYAQQHEDENPMQTLARATQINLATAMPTFRSIGEENLKKLFDKLSRLTTFTAHLHLIIEHVNPGASLESLIALIKDRLLSSYADKRGVTVDSIDDESKKQLAKIREINKRFDKPEFEEALNIIQILEKAQNSDAQLPLIILKSETIGLYPGHYMTKLPKTDVRNAMLGHFMGNCQHMASPHGQSCVVHAITSPLGAHYCIFKGNVVDGETQINMAHDPIEVSSWSWRHKERICFDSVEYDAAPIKQDGGIQNALPPHRQLTAEQIMSIFYNQFALKLIEADETVQCVTVGFSRHAKTPACIGISDNVLNDQMADDIIFYKEGVPYKGHTDAHKQRYLATRENRAQVQSTLFNLYQAPVDLHAPLPMQQTQALPHGFQP